jgi:hypothetical protein
VYKQNPLPLGYIAEFFFWFYKMWSCVKDTVDLVLSVYLYLYEKCLKKKHETVVLNPQELRVFEKYMAQKDIELMSYLRQKKK